ncbi:MAG: gliding motility-associated C-terminal domain-containing protein [Bacteroidia bacterium]
MKKATVLLSILLSVIYTTLLAQPGKSGAFTVSTANTIVNEYTTLTANATAGNTSITVANSALNSNGRFSSSLSQGDLIMIIQMQGASIEGTLQAPPGNPIGLPIDSTWGSITAYNNAGNNEFLQVTSVPNGTTINVSCGLKNNYTVTGKVQIVRMPRYSTLTINNASVLSCDPWNSKTGGIVAVEVSGNTTINTGGEINTTALGFRGGLIPSDSSVYGIVLYACQSTNVGGARGEGIAGYASDYDPNGGRYCRGAAANAGGGGNSWNCGGGGGSNSGNIAQWSGKGNPDISTANYIAAWNLEYFNFSSLTSSGGGRGGYSWSGSNQNPITMGPSNSNWGGDQRRPNGGLGGRPLDYSTGRLFLGGGGGAGHQDNNFGGVGGYGGGMIYVLSYGQVLGGGQIISDGANGQNAQGNPAFGSYAGQDGAGGAGGGGTIIIQSTGTIAGGISVHADGGTGGNQVISKSGTFFGSVKEAEGPGGGGGGGYIATTNAVTETVAGGANGTTNSPPLAQFPPNGATKGGAGIISVISTYAITADDTTICSGNTVTLTAKVTGTLPVGTSVAWFTTTGTEITTGLNYTPSPALTVTTTFYVGSCPGTNMIPVTITVGPTANTTITPVGPFCLSSPVINLTAATNGGTWSGTGITNTSNGTFNPATAGVGSHIIKYKISGACADSSTTTIVVNSSANTTITPAGPFCTNSPILNLTAATSGGIWSGTGITSSTNGTFNPATAGVGSFVIKYKIGGACADSSTTTIIVNAVPNTTITPVGPFCLSSPVINLTAATNGGIWSGTGITNTSNGTFNPATAGVGSHIIKYKISGACADSSTTTIVVNSSANTTITPAGPFCTNSPVLNLTAATSGGIWSGTGITNTANGTFNPATAGVGSFVIKYKIGGTCADSSTTTIVVNAVPNTSITPAGPFCLSSPAINLTAATSGGTWSGTGITNSTNGTFNPATAGVGSYTIKYIISGACPDSSTTTIVVNSSANTTITPAGPFCSDASAINLTAATSGGIWSGTGITNTANGTFNPATAGAGSFVIKYKISGACADSSTTTIVVNAVPNTTINAVGNLCTNGSSVNLTAVTPGGTWSGTGITNTSTGVFNPSVSGAGTFTITYKIGGACPDSSITTITVSQTPVVTFSVSPTSGCAPLCVNFTDNSVGSCTSINWTFGDGNSSSSTNPSHCYSSAGAYDVTMTCNNNGCIGTKTIDSMVTVSPSPIASFTMNPTGDVLPNTTVNFTNTSTAGSTITWNFGDPLSGAQNNSILSSPMHTYADTGSYCVTLIAQAGGCTDSVKQCFEVIGQISLNIPNAFTPNGDGKNDLFFIRTTGIVSMTCDIFDRWGIKIYTLNGIGATWNGLTTSGNKANAGTYYYMLKATGVNGTVKQEKGFVELIR